MQARVEELRCLGPELFVCAFRHNDTQSTMRDPAPFRPVGLRRGSGRGLIAERHRYLPVKKPVLSLQIRENFAQLALPILGTFAASSSA
jgi:hypothetical protein